MRVPNPLRAYSESTACSIHLSTLGVEECLYVSSRFPCCDVSGGVGGIGVWEAIEEQGDCRVKCVHMRFWMKLGNSVVSDIGDMLTWRLWPLVGWKGESEKEWGERDRGVCVCVVCKRWSVIVKLCCVVRPKFGLVWGCRCYNFEAAEWMHSHFWGCEILRSEWTWRGMQVAWSLRAIAIGVESFFEWEWEVKSLSVVASRGILSLRSEVTTSSRSFRINSRLLLVYLTINRLVI